MSDILDIESQFGSEFGEDNDRKSKKEKVIHVH